LYCNVASRAFTTSVVLWLARMPKPTIMVELLRKWMASFGNSPRDVLLLLQELGYESYSITSQGLREIFEINNDTVENNFLFVHPSNKNHRSIARSYLRK
jgi:hypothetical protein